MDEHRRSKTLFLAVTFLFWITLYLYVPTLPIYIKLKTADLATVGMVLSMYGLWMAFARLPMGIHQSFYATGMFTGPWVSGIIADYMGIRPVFFMTAGGFFILAFLFLGLLRRRDRTGT